MTFSWLFFATIGALAARYMKDPLGKLWHVIHISLSVLTFVGTLVSIIVIGIYVGRDGDRDGDGSRVVGRVPEGYSVQIERKTEEGLVLAALLQLIPTRLLPGEGEEGTREADRSEDRGEGREVSRGEDRGGYKGRVGAQRGAGGGGEDAVRATGFHTGHFSTLHAVLGWCTFAFLIIQSFVGLLSSYYRDPLRDATPLWPDLAHHYIGYTLLLAGLMSCFSGLTSYNETPSLTWLCLFLWLISMLLFVALFELFHRGDTPSNRRVLQREYELMERGVRLIEQSNVGLLWCFVCCIIITLLLASVMSTLVDTYS